MGKISDLWVRLGLKKNEFDKGMDDVQKKTKATEGVFTRIKSAGLAAWAAIGTGLIAFGKQLITSTNEMEDVWDMFTSKAKAGWESFVRAVANNSTWSAFIADFKASLAAAGKLAEALQDDTEILNSIKIQKARIGKELSELEIAMRDQTKSYADRAAAAQRYLSLVDPIYKKEIERVKQLRDAQYESFMAGSRWDPSVANNPVAQKIWEDMLVAYGDPIKIAELGNKTFMAAIADYMSGAPAAVTGPNEKANQEENRRLMNEWLATQEKLFAYAMERFGFASTEQAQNWLDAFYTHYEKNNNGESVQGLIDAILAYYEADRAFSDETRVF